MDTYYQFVEIALVTFGLLVALGATGFVLALMPVLTDAIKRKLAVIDRNPAVVAFGNTATGQLLYQQANNLHGLVDEPTDPLVVQAVALVHKILPVTDDMVTREQVSQAFSVVTEGLKQLLDGVAEPPPAG